MRRRTIEHDQDPLIREALTDIWGRRYREAYALVARHRGRPPENLAVAALILRGRGYRRRAARRLDRMDPDRTNYGLVAALLWSYRRREDAVALFVELPMENMATIGVVVLGATVLRSGGDLAEVFDRHPDRCVAGEAGMALFHEGRYAEAAEWFTERGTTPDHAYNVASAWGRAGEVERALDALDRAATHGFTDGVYADFDDDLFHVRRHPRWPYVRARLGGPTAAG